MILITGKFSFVKPPLKQDNREASNKSNLKLAKRKKSMVRKTLRSELTLVNEFKETYDLQFRCAGNEIERNEIKLGNCMVFNL